MDDHSQFWRITVYGRQRYLESLCTFLKKDTGNSIPPGSVINRARWRCTKRDAFSASRCLHFRPHCSVARNAPWRGFLAVPHRYKYDRKYESIPIFVLPCSLRSLTSGSSWLRTLNGEWSSAWILIVNNLVFSLIISSSLIISITSQLNFFRNYFIYFIFSILNKFESWIYLNFLIKTDCILTIIFNAKFSIMEILQILASANRREIETCRTCYRRQEVLRQRSYQANTRLAPVCTLPRLESRRGDDDDRRRRREIMSHSGAGSALSHVRFSVAPARNCRAVEITGGDWRRPCTAVRKLNAVR